MPYIINPLFPSSLRSSLKLYVRAVYLVIDINLKVLVVRLPSPRQAVIAINFYKKPSLNPYLSQPNNVQLLPVTALYTIFSSDVPGIP